MGASNSRAAQLRATLRVPLTGAYARSAGVIGTLTLDYSETMNGCGGGGGGVDKPACCTSRAAFRVPWPCHCCGADCACCLHAPRGAAWYRALAGGGVGALLADASAIAGAYRLGASGYVALAELAAARGLALEAQWTPRANAFLAAFGLHAAAFAWVEDRRDDKGNKTGEVTRTPRTALQFYNGVAQPGAVAVTAPAYGALPQGVTYSSFPESSPQPAFGVQPVYVPQGFYPAPAAAVNYGTAETGAAKVLAM
jgi:hypothetical protein